jgi:diguanylate cyclase (GGDEF)-like protein
MKRILIVDDDQDIARILRFRLQKKGFDCVLAANGLEALDKIDTHHPDLVLLDVMMPKMDGFTTCREIRKRNAWSRIPVIMLTAKGDTSDKVSGIGEGADDYVVKPFEFDELLARIRMIMRRTSETMSANPLTGLPGNNVISKNIEAAIAARIGFAACYVDLDHFKAYNDEYGFEAGDKIIKRTADILVAVCQARAKQSFVGHIGGDDYLFLVDLDSFEQCCKDAIRRFDAEILDFYNKEHIEAGFIESENRQGQTVRFPIMSVSIGVVTSSSGDFTNAMQVSNRAAEMKKYAKGQLGSVYKVDRRSTGAQDAGVEQEVGPAAGSQPEAADADERSSEGSGR